MLNMLFGDIQLNMTFDNGTCRCHGQLSPNRTSSGDIARVTPITDKEGNTDYTDCIMQRLGIWLAVKKGERPLFPNFGCCIRDYINEPMTYSKLLDLQGQVERELRNDVFPEKEFTVSNVRVEPIARGEIRVSANVGNYAVEFLGNAAAINSLESQLARALSDLGMTKT